MVCDKVVCVSKLCVTKMGARSGRERERDTESKTRTPHKDVGEKTWLFGMPMKASGELQ